MKKVLGILAVIIVVVIIVISVLPRKVSTTDLSKVVPIVEGKIVSAKSFRSDDLTRGIEVVVETNLSLKEVAEYYSSEFTKRDIIVMNMPAFAGNSRDLENSTEADAIAETKSHQQVVVNIRSQSNLTQVTIQVKGNSILFLPY